MKKTAFVLVVALAAILTFPSQQGRVRAQSKPPNILFAISDDQSWMRAGAYGDKATKTPAFDRIAREGVLVNYAYTAAPSCAPSRSAILTGRHIWELEEGGILLGILRAKFKVFTLLLEDAGYELGATGKTWGPGRLEGWTRKIFGKTVDSHRISDPPPGIRATDYAANFEEFIQERDKEKPFFFWLGTSEPHQRYDVGAWKRAGKKLEDARLPPWLPDDPVTRGDHGNPLPRSKCNLYDGGTGVPLAVRWPSKIPAGRKVDDFVSLTDMAPTILDIAGVPIPEEVSGHSLRPVLESSKSGRVDDSRDFVVTAFERHTVARRNAVGYPMRALRTHRYAYIRNYEPDRWPAGDPDYNAPPQGFYGDVDRGATKTFLIEKSQDPKMRRYFLMSSKRFLTANTQN